MFIFLHNNSGISKRDPYGFVSSEEGCFYAPPISYVPPLFNTNYFQLEEQPPDPPSPSDPPGEDPDNGGPIPGRRLPESAPPVEPLYPDDDRVPLDD